MPIIGWFQKISIPYHGNTKSVRHVLFGNKRLVRVYGLQQNIINGQSVRNTDLIIFCYNHPTNSSTLRPLRCDTCCTIHLHKCLLLLPASVVHSCLIYKLGKLTGQWFQAKLTCLPSGNSLNSELKLLPHAFGIPNCITPHPFRIPVQETPLSLGIPRCCPWYGTDIFWNHPFCIPPNLYTPVHVPYVPWANL